MLQFMPQPSFGFHVFHALVLTDILTGLCDLRGLVILSVVFCFIILIVLHASVLTDILTGLSDLRGLVSLASYHASLLHDSMHFLEL